MQARQVDIAQTRFLSLAIVMFNMLVLNVLYRAEFGRLMSAQLFK
jgi:hypothetical protein